MDAGLCWEYEKPVLIQLPLGNRRTLAFMTEGAPGEGHGSRGMEDGGFPSVQLRGGHRGINHI